MKAKVVAGIFATLLVLNIFLFAVPVRASPGTIKVGIIGPVGLPHWSPGGMKEAAEMAVEEITTAGGITLNDGAHNIEVVFGNEYALPTPDPDAAKAEMERLALVEGGKIVMGGFRTEVTAAMVEAAADLGIVFLINGASTDSLIDETIASSDPAKQARYKYIFRINPIKSTMLFITMGGFVQLAVGTKLLPIYGKLFAGNPQVPIAVLTEDLAWTAVGHYKLTTPSIYPAILGPYVNVTYADRIPETATDMSVYLDNVEASGAAIMLMVFSGRPGLPLIQQWAARNMKCIPYGINVLAQIEDHWTQTGGGCNLEAFLDFAGTRTPIITTGDSGATVDFWDNFVGRTGKWPIYTAWGAYDGLWGFKQALEDYNTHTASINLADVTADKIVEIYETGYYPYGFRTGLSGKFVFATGNVETNPLLPALPARHDVTTFEYDHYWNLTYYNPSDPLSPVRGFVRAMNVQWQDGVKEVVSPILDGAVALPSSPWLSYARKFKVNPLTYPSGYESLADSDTVSHPKLKPTDIGVYSVDGSITTLDIAQLAGLAPIGLYPWLSTPASPYWNFNGDLDNNQLIDIVDVTLVAVDYGKGVSYPLTW